MNGDSEELKQAAEGQLTEPKTLYCLAVDFVESTANGLSLRSWEIDRFNAAWFSSSILTLLPSALNTRLLNSPEMAGSLCHQPLSLGCVASR